MAGTGHRRHEQRFEGAGELGASDDRGQTLLEHAQEPGEGDADDGEGKIIAAERPEGRRRRGDELGHEVERRRRQEDAGDGGEEGELVGQGLTEIAPDERGKNRGARPPLLRSGSHGLAPHSSTACS